MNPLTDNRTFHVALDMLLGRFVSRAEDVPPMAETLRTVAMLLETDPEVRAAFGIVDEAGDEPAS